MDPLPPPACLKRARSSSQKGGTLIAEDVVTLEAHSARVCDPDRYRPSRCANCNHDKLHVHDYRERKWRGRMEPPIRVVRYRCAAAGCRAHWLMLPAFLARHLSRSWKYIEQKVRNAPANRRARTLRRWRARLRSAARFLVQVLASSGASRWADVASEVPLQATRWQVVEALAEPFSGIAALLHRLVPGARLM